MIEVGDKVGYRVRWLRSINMCHTYLGRARGTVVAIRDLGQRHSVATVEWNDGEVPAKVLTSNLAKPGTLAFTSEDK